jgi:hypothetical protein
LEKVSNTHLDLSETELDRMLQSINQLASVIKVEDLERETSESRQQADEIVQSVEQIEQSWPPLLAEVNSTVSTFNEHQASRQANDAKLAEFDAKNAGLDTDLKLVATFILLFN